MTKKKKKIREVSVPSIPLDYSKALFLEIHTTDNYMIKEVYQELSQGFKDNVKVIFKGLDSTVFEIRNQLFGNDDLKEWFIFMKNIFESYHNLLPSFVERPKMLEGEDL